ncbi:MAG: hypothetical protein RR177_01645 [Oscillospiraceae bacterium]
MIKRLTRTTAAVRIVAALVCLLMIFSVFGLQANAQGKDKVITITTNSDINPFIRVGLHKRTFSSGGPFTIRCDVKVTQFQKTKSDGHIFYNIVDGRDPNQMTVWCNQVIKKTDGWVEMVDDKGKYITFNNIDKVLISGAFESFALFQMGVYYGKANVSFRNFRVLNAAGNIVYSWNTDPNFDNITNLKEIQGDTMFALTFGDGSADIIVSEGDSAATDTSSDSGGDYEEGPTTPQPGGDQNSKPSSAGNGTTTNPSDTGTTSTVSDNSDSAYEAPGNVSSVESNSSQTGESTDSSQQTDTKNKGGNVWVVVLIVIGAVLVLCAVAFVVLWKMNKLPWLKNKN